MLPPPPPTRELLNGRCCLRSSPSESQLLNRPLPTLVTNTVRVLPAPGNASEAGAGAAFAAGAGAAFAAGAGAESASSSELHPTITRLNSVNTMISEANFFMISPFPYIFI